MAVSVTGWPKFGMICILSDVGGCTQLVIAVYQHTVGKLGLIALLCQASHLCGSARPVAVHLRGAGAAKRISLQRTKKDTLVQKQRGLSQATAPGKPRH